MIAKVIDGKKIAAEYRLQLQAQINSFELNYQRKPGLAVVLVGEDPASQIYVKNKQQACDETGIASYAYNLPKTISSRELIVLIHKLNDDKNIHAILVQLPLPTHIDEGEIIDAIDPAKDVDGFHPYNLGRLAQGRPFLRPCTPLGIMHLLKTIDVPLSGKNATIIGASNIVGKPMALELLMAGCTNTICHRLTSNLPSFVKQADLVISAVGNPGMIKGEWIKENAIVIDVGITRLANGTLTGDVEFAAAAQRASWITPVPGGVGPMTVVMLLQNTLQAAIAQEKG